MKFTVICISKIYNKNVAFLLIMCMCRVLFYDVVSIQTIECQMAGWFISDELDGFISWWSRINWGTILAFAWWDSCKATKTFHHSQCAIWDSNSAYSPHPTNTCVTAVSSVSFLLTNTNLSQNTHWCYEIYYLPIQTVTTGINMKCTVILGALL